MSRHRTHYVVVTYWDLLVAYVIVVTCALKRAAKCFLEGRIVVYLPCNDRGDG